MTCASCVIINENSLNDLDGVTSVSINLATNIASVEFDEMKSSFEDIKKDIESN
jgi:Cu+-exporting ATPase